MTQYAAYPDEELMRPRPRRHVRRTSATALLLRGITTCVVLAGGLLLGDIVLRWVGDSGEFDGRVSDPTPVTLFVGKQRLSIPANMFRFPEQRTVGPVDKVDLAIHWPDLGGYSAASRSDYTDMGPNAPVLFVTIRTRDTLTDSAGRLVSVYQHFFEEGTIPAPEGLVGHRLSEDSGLEGEEVYFEAGSTQPFTVHCSAPDGSGYPAACLSEIHAGDDLSVQLRFRKGLLPHWAGIKSGLKVLLLTFGVTS